jgi:hypothetical protein
MMLVAHQPVNLTEREDREGNILQTNAVPLTGRAAELGEEKYFELFVTYVPATHSIPCASPRCARAQSLFPPPAPATHTRLVC